VKAGKLNKLRAQRLLKEIGFDPNYLNPIQHEITTLESTKQSPTKFASINSKHCFQPIQKSKHISMVAEPASPNHQSCIVKDNLYKVGLAALAGVGLYFLMISYIKPFGKSMGERRSEKYTLFIQFKWSIWSK